MVELYRLLSSSGVPVAFAAVHNYDACCFMQNKSAFLCGVMKTYRQREKQGSKVQESNKGPDEAKIKVKDWNCYK